MRVISLAGPKGSGKNTFASQVARALHETHRKHLREVAFADPMRWAADCLGLPNTATRGRKSQPCAELGGATGRDFLISLGEMLRGYSPDFWAAHMAARLEEFGVDPCEDGRIIVTDTRRHNELDTLERWAAAAPGRSLAKLWVERPGHDADEVLEASVRARCVVLQNAGTLADLEAKADGVTDWLATGSGRRIGGPL